MTSLAFSPAGITDIETIWDDTAANWRRDQADRYTDEIHDACLGVAEGSKWGRAVEVRHGFLKVSTGSHMVSFIETGDRGDVIRILHGKQDVDRHL